MVRRVAMVVIMMVGLALVWVAPARATITGSTLVGSTATVTADGAGTFDQFTIDKSGGNLRLDTGGGPSVDWDSTTPGDQTLADDAGSTVIINAGAGIDIVNIGFPGDTFASHFEINGAGGADFLTVYPGAAGADTVTINGNGLTGTNLGHVSWDQDLDQVNIRTGANSDVVTVATTPSSPQVLVYAEGGDDTLKLANGTALSSSPGTNSAFRGGPGTDTVDYSAWTTPVSVDLARTAKFRASLSKTGTVPDSGSAATGSGFVELTDLATGTFDYELDASQIDSANITAAHLHNAAGDTLVDIGAGGSWTSPDSTDPSTEVDGTTDPDINEPVLRAGTTYFDIHTTAHATGEIQGQLTLDPDDGYGGSGTGVPRMLTVENLIGGSGNDTFKGSIPVNSFTCGGGQDSVTTGPGDTTTGCETVNGVTTQPPPPAVPVGSVSALKPKAKAKGKKLIIDTGATAACPAGATGACTVAASATAKIGKKTVTLGKASTGVAAGQSSSITIKVSKKAAKAWRKAGRLKVTVTVTLTVPGGSPVTVTKPARLRPSKAK